MHGHRMHKNSLARRIAGLILHVRTRGQTYQLPLQHGLGSERDIVRYAERELGLEPHALDDHAVDRSDDGVVIRPWAVWG